MTKKKAKDRTVNKSHIGLWGTVNFKTGRIQLFKNFQKIKAGSEVIFWMLIGFDTKNCYFASQPYGEQIEVEKRFVVPPITYKLPK